MVERINSPRVLGKTLKGPSNVHREHVIPSHMPPHPQSCPKQDDKKASRVPSRHQHHTAVIMHCHPCEHGHLHYNLQPTLPT